MVYVIDNNQTPWYKLKKIRIWTQIVRPSVPATAITLNKSSIELNTAWATEQLTATLTPADSTSTVSWSSSDTSIATVSQSWLVTCVTPWSCTITATTSNGLTATCSIAQWWWQPWANTLLYLPLESDEVDQSWKTGRTFSTSWISYTTVWWVKSAHVGASWWAYLTAPKPIVYNSVSQQTISVLYYVTSNYSSSRRQIIEFADQSDEYFNVALKEYTTVVQYSDSNSWYWSWTTIVANQWNHVVVTWDSSARKIYINGSLAWTWSWSRYPWWSWWKGYQEYQWILCNRDWGYGGALNWNARELILEDKVWTAQEVAEYYTWIKAKLWF